MILGICFVLPILGILLLSVHVKRMALPVLLVVASLNAALSAAFLAHTPVQFTETFGLVPSSSTVPYFVNDAFSRLFVTLISMIFLGVSLYIYNRVQISPVVVFGIDQFVRLALLFVSVAIAALMSNHLILMWIFLEATTLAAVPLIYYQTGHQNGNQQGAKSFRAAWMYLMFSSVGLGLGFLGLICLAKGMALTQGAGTTLFLSDLAQQNFIPSGNLWLEIGLVLIIFGFGSKLGLAPMYAWLPKTYDAAPPSVTVLLAAIQFNCVILGIFRVFEHFHPIQSETVRLELIAMGLFSIILAAIHIVGEKNYKKLIAYASMNHAGVIALGLAMGKSAAYGVVLYVLSNALVKSILFLTCGNIKARYQTKTIADLQGLIKSMPFSGWFLMVGIFALLGFAPFGSFFGEVIIMSSMLELNLFIVFTLFCLVLTVVFIATGRSIFPMIWGEPMAEPSLKGESIYTLLPNLFFISILVSLGIYIPSSANELLKEIALRIGGQ